MIDLDNQTTLHFDITILENIASYLSNQDVELIIVDDMTMKSLNLSHRGKAYSTDVLSFPISSINNDSHFNMPLGSIVIAASYVIDKSEYYKHSTQDELSLLFIHGMLHLLGFNHENDNGEMRKEEEKIINMFDLPKSLIIRTEEF